MHFNPSSVEMPTWMALAILGVLAYVFCILPRRNRKKMLGMQRALAQARATIGDMEGVVSTIQEKASEHYSRLKKLKGRLTKFDKCTDETAWHDLCHEIEGILAPTLKLIAEIGSAQECFRHHSANLQRFSELQSDPLTGVGNRRALQTVMEAQLGIVKRYGTQVSMAVFDIDHFKTLNDERGHLQGDEALRGLANLIGTVVRAADVVARYGGDEFVVVMPETDLHGAGTLAERLRIAIADSTSFTVSVGLTSALATDTPELMFERADVALYRAKSDGRNRTCCHNGHGVQAVLLEDSTPSTVSGIAFPQHTDAIVELAKTEPFLVASR